MNVSMAVEGDLQPAAIDLVRAVAPRAGSFGAGSIAFSKQANETAKRIRLKIVLVALR
jgi:hypothetical protein